MNDIIDGLLIIPKGIAEIILRLVEPRMLGLILGSILFVTLVILFLNWMYPPNPLNQFIKP